MGLYALCLVKNEADVIAQSLTHASRFCDRIYVLDNGSQDETWNIVQHMSDLDNRIVAFKVVHGEFDNNLRGQIYDAFHKDMSDDDWWLLLDADEFMADDPRGAIQEANSVGADVINAWQALFYFTEDDLSSWNAGTDSRSTPIIERRRYYRIDEQERRLFKNRKSGSWENSALLQRNKKLRRRVINRHYRYRDPDQIKSRLEVRYGHSAFSTQVKTLDVAKFIRPTRGLTFRVERDRWAFTLMGMLVYINGWIISWRKRIRTAFLSLDLDRWRRHQSRRRTELL